MRHLTPVLAVLLLTACATVNPVKREYYSFLEIKRDYELSYKEAKDLLSNDSIQSMYHCGKDLTLYKIDDVERFLNK